MVGGRGAEGGRPCYTTSSYPAPPLHQPLPSCVTPDKVPHLSADGSPSQTRGPESPTQTILKAGARL